MSSPEIPFLINDDGLPFDDEKLKEVESKLLLLISEDSHVEFSNENTEAIAKHPSSNILIVSGPGTGKSRLFLDRIKYWLSADKSADILVTSFVNKLVSDLELSIRELPEEYHKRVDVSTVHRLARSIVEKNRGTAEWAFCRHVNVIGQDWKQVVWSDALAFHDGQLSQPDYPWDTFEGQLFDACCSEDSNWKSLKQTYYEICQFYNAAGFADLILRARAAIRENPGLRKYEYIIIDEFQDFNMAEQLFLNELMETAKGTLIVGDDDQVL